MPVKQVRKENSSFNQGLFFFPFLKGQKGNRRNRKNGVTKVAVDIAELLGGGLSEVVQGKGSWGGWHDLTRSDLIDSPTNFRREREREGCRMGGRKRRKFLDLIWCLDLMLWVTADMGALLSVSDLFVPSFLFGNGREWGRWDVFRKRKKERREGEKGIAQDAQRMGAIEKI